MGDQLNAKDADVTTKVLVKCRIDMHAMKYVILDGFECDTINYPLFVHEIRKDIYGWVQEDDSTPDYVAMCLR